MNLSLIAALCLCALYAAPCLSIPMTANDAEVDVHKRGISGRDILSHKSCRYNKKNDYCKYSFIMNKLCYTTCRCNDILSQKSCRILRVRNKCKTAWHTYCRFECDRCIKRYSGITKNCAEALKSGGKKSGVYTVKPDSKGAFKVYCDQKTNGGGWAVIQRRQDGSVNFYRGWNDYKNGFGNLKGEFWLGLDKIYRLTHQTRNRLRVELTDWKGKTAYAEYTYFAVAKESKKYKLSLGSYSGTAGDSLKYHRGMAFSTKDRDNDKYSGGSCAVRCKGAWWYKNCYASNLNGLYYKGGVIRYDGLVWYHLKSKYYSLKRDEMKIRPV